MNSDVSRGVVADLLKPSSRGLAGGMTCAVWSAVLLLYAADYVFLRLPFLIGAARPYMTTWWPHELFFLYGVPMWCGMAVFSLLSLVFAFRNKGRRGWVTFNVCVLIASVGFAFLVRQAAWNSFDRLGGGV